MSDIQIYKKIVSLPEDLKKQVIDFIISLEEKPHVTENKKDRQFGCANGFFKMSEDFEETLDDFKDYM